jgi:hypothetical protein
MFCACFLFVCYVCVYVVGCAKELAKTIQTHKHANRPKEQNKQSSTNN